ncbi:hypothetical protein ACUN7Z_16565 [Vreelandella venusta]|uniref:hypothetical protein n=1 Tax=Vreelandella venusta TaxID=44935 RepID=UPI00295F20F4|nr:hypothetical protein [Halomonas venusta]MDW0360157.1 hypothetical protein [Halomonas venusta]
MINDNAGLREAQLIGQVIDQAEEKAIEAIESRVVTVKCSTSFKTRWQAAAETATAQWIN